MIHEESELIGTHEKGPPQIEQAGPQTADYSGKSNGSLVRLTGHPRASLAQHVQLCDWHTGSGRCLTCRAQGAKGQFAGSPCCTS